MEDEGLRKLVHFMFLRDFPNLAEMSTKSSLPSIMLTQHFSQRMNLVIGAKRMVMYCRYRKFVDTCCYKMFTSHEMYLRYVIFACVTEHNCNKNIFESFLSVCAGLAVLSANTLFKTGMNFQDLNPDIFMVFYQGMMHKFFKKAGGLQQFAEHILDHRYLEKFDRKAIKDVDDLKNDETSLCDFLKVEGYELKVYPDAIENNSTSFFLAKKVLLKRRVELPTLLTKRELVVKRVAYNRTKMEKEAEVKLKKETTSKIDHSKNVLEKPVISNKDSRTIQEGKSKTDQADIANIVQLVMKYKSDSKISNKAEQKENTKQNEDIVQSVMRSNSNTDSKSNYAAEQKNDNVEKGNIVEAVMKSKTSSDSNTNYEAEQKRNKVEGNNVEAVIMSHSNSDSKTNSKADQKENNVEKKGIVEAAVVSKLNLESKNSYEADQKENNSKNDVTIQNVMTYNRSDKVILGESDKIMLKKVKEIVDHLENSIKSVIKVLNEYDEE